MKRVGFITPDNGFFQMNYNEVENFCKKICLSEENKDEFLEFKKDYSYFSPYFDFVMVKKKFLFFNPLYRNRQFWIFDKGAYYQDDLVGIKYEDNVSHFNEKKSKTTFVSDATLVSDSELEIRKADSLSLGECLVDANGVRMMSKTGTFDDDGSHPITASTVLNQLLSKSIEIAKAYSIYLRDVGIDDVSDAVNYLVKDVGFIRVAGSGSLGIVIGNSDFFTDEINNLVMELESQNYSFFNSKNYTNSMIDKYQENLNVKNL